MTMWGAGVYVPAGAREGQSMSSGNTVLTGIAEGAVRAGLILVRGTTIQEAQHPPVIPVAVVDSLITNAVGASALAAFSYDTIAEFDGAIGMGRINPAVPITWTTDASVDWNTVTGACAVDIYGEDANGEPIHDHLEHPNGAGVATYTTEHCYSAVSRIDQQACLGAGGTCTFGTSAARCELGSQYVRGVAMYDRSTPPAATVGYDYDAHEVVPIVTEGWVAATTEDAVVPGEQVYCRVVVAGADLRGQFTGALRADDANFARVLGWTWETTTAGGGVGVIRVRS